MEGLCKIRLLGKGVYVGFVTLGEKGAEPIATSPISI